MRKLKLAALLLLVLCGCTGISNEEIIRETKKCQDAGLRADLVYEGIMFTPRRIVCIPNDNVHK